MKKVKIKIDGKTITCSPDKTIMEAARDNGIKIPGLCYHPDFAPKANCRICVVEIKGIKKLMTSCSTKVRDGMEIKTNTERVKKVRNLNIELIFAEHIEKCPDCIWNVNCGLLKLAERYDIKIKRFTDRKKERKIIKFANAVEIDGSQCIDCRNCIDACLVLQNINYLKLKGKGADQEIVENKIPNLTSPKRGRTVAPLREEQILPLLGEAREGTNNKIDCIYCGQCTVHCPVSAAQEQNHWENVEEKLYDKSKIVIAQFAPSIRVSIGEEFGLPYGKIATGQVVAGLKKLGFDYVFDVNFGADITTIVEAKELLERLAKNKIQNSILPMITSCCPAWVKYVEFYHPELIPNLTTARSPHIHLGGTIKTYWAEKMNINPKNIIVVSIMPCTAKKFESSRKELKVKNLFPVDYVLTTREFVWMMKKHCVNFAKIKEEQADRPLGEYSGAAAIYGGSGGVMESALRSARFFACGGDKKKESKVCKLNPDFKSVRGFDNVKETTVFIAGAKLRVAVVNGIGNIEQILENLNNYDYIEVMVCPGGCIGGGGQPIPTTDEIRKKRMAALYQIDKGKKIREAHRNKGVLEVLEWLKNQGKLEHQVLHTKYIERK